ncbi:MAG TPA: peptidoglycan-binding domain-containing protein [Candidatus Limnocylindrales bacterium]
MRRVFSVTVVAAAIVMLIAGTSSVAGARPGVGNLKYGSVGPGVKCVQVAYNVLAGQGLATDGVYLDLTRQATVNWQTFFGLKVDGIVGPITGESIQGIWDFRFGSGSWKNQWVQWKGVSFRCWGVVPSQT